MKLTFLTVWFLVLYATVEAGQRFPALDNLRPSASPTEQQTAVKELMKRVIGDRSDVIDVVIKPNMGKDGGDAFHLETVGGRLQISGTTGVAASMGFYYLLKELCGCQYTWAGQQLKLPASLPSLPSPGITVPVLDRFRYFQNVCTVSYSFAWYNASDWEKMIDWMALQGINLPLAFTGQEAIFQKVYLDMGFTQEDMDAFFGGPAFLAWARMGNLRGWGGPLSQSWMDDQKEIQKAVLKRMRSFGMMPVLPGFAGFVPEAITRLFPNASITQMGQWGNLPNQYTNVNFLDPKDPLFKRIAVAFMKEMEKEYGLDHVYNADSFNENDPPSSDWGYLTSYGKAMYEPMREVDPDAVWIIQGWMFSSSSFWGEDQMRALLTSVPKGRLLVLDLQSEANPVYPFSDSFYGQPFIWNLLHNFGGTMTFYGNLDDINGGPAKGRAFPNSTMVGLGITAEGIFQNEVVYELMMEQAWRPDAVNLTDWVSNFTVQRYGVHNPYIERAWQLLKNSVYSGSKFYHDGDQSPVTKRPQLDSDSSLWFNPGDEFQAWELMLQASKGMQDNVLFKYDLVDLTRDSLQTLFCLTRQNFSLAYYGDATLDSVTFGTRLVELLEDLETLLASDGHFLLGHWVEAARAFGRTEAERRLLEFNARNQVTVWGPNGNFLDYAGKQWSGLVNDYYLPRWRLFVLKVIAALARGVDFDQDAYNREVYARVETPFTHALGRYPTTPSGDSIAISRHLFEKYKPLLQSYVNLLADDKLAMTAFLSRVADLHRR